MFKMSTKPPHCLTLTFIVDEVCDGSDTVVGTGVRDPVNLDRSSETRIVTRAGNEFALDPDGDPQATSITYAITGGNTNAQSSTVFMIDTVAVTGEGQIRVASATLDYETKAQYVLTITATDTGSPSQTSTATFTIDVDDRNDRPTVDDATFSVTEGTPVGTEVGTPNYFT